MGTEALCQGCLPCVWCRENLSGHNDAMHTHESGCYKKNQKLASVVEGVEKSEALCPASRNGKCAASGKQYGLSLRRGNIDFLCNPVHRLLGIYARELRTET